MRIDNKNLVTDTSLISISYTKFIHKINLSIKIIFSSSINAVNFGKVKNFTHYCVCLKKNPHFIFILINE